MPEDRPNGSKGQLNAKRRQQYFARRRFIAGLDTKKPTVVVERMSTTALWSALERNLLDTLNFARDHSSVTLYGQARDAWECYAELMARGDQLRLFDD